MKYRLLEVLECPHCKRGLSLEGEKVKKAVSHVDKDMLRNPHCNTFCGLLSKSVEDVGKECNCFECFQKEITEGILHCTQCAIDYPIYAEVPRLIPRTGQDRGAKQVKEKFEFQWQAWGDETRIFGRKEEANTQFILMGHTALTADFFKGKLVLDGGCGHGRFLRSFSLLGAESVGIDFGSGIDIAHRFNEADGMVHTVMGDLLNMPLKQECVDYVFCSGVTHHTPNPWTAFNNLVRSLKKGGMIFIWVYPKQGVLWEVSQKLLRAVLTKLHPKILYYLCFLPVPLLYAVRTYSSTSLRTASWRQCAQVIYDWYSPKYQFHYTEEELKEWFVQASFDDLEFFPIKTGLAGRKRV